jgi:hypothetical protein
MVTADGVIMDILSGGGQVRHGQMRVGRTRASAA